MRLQDSPIASRNATRTKANCAMLLYNVALLASRWQIVLMFQIQLKPKKCLELNDLVQAQHCLSIVTHIIILASNTEPST